MKSALWLLALIGVVAVYYIAAWVREALRKGWWR